MLDKNNRIPNNYQSKIGFDTLNQNLFLKEIIKIMGTTITDIDKELKMKFSRKKYSETKSSCDCN